jgi:Putative Flp pilus-assembly TadE/G-like
MPRSKHRNHSDRASSVRKLMANQNGNIAPMFAMALVPMIGVLGLAVDFDRYNSTETRLQTIADAASLAGASNLGNPAAQKAAAEAFLDAQPLEQYGIEYVDTVTTPTGQVQVVLATNLKGTFLPVFLAATGESVSTGDFDFDVVSRANFLKSKGKKVCMLTLNATAQNAMYFSGSGNITATGCGFQSNSNHLTQSMHLQGSAVATADFFKSVGGWDVTGNRAEFSVPPESGAEVFNNPFLLSDTCPTTAGSNVTVSGTAASPTALNASVYNDITVRNNKYGTFSAGTHYIKGTINMTGGLLKGTGVTLVLCGANAKLNMNGGDLQLEAPKTGAYAGFAVIGNNTATSVSELQGGPATYIRGIFYTPKGQLKISGNSDFNVNSSYFPIIADAVTLTGSGKVNIGMDWAAYGFQEPTALTLPDTLTVWLDR